LRAPEQVTKKTAERLGLKRRDQAFQLPKKKLSRGKTGLYCKVTGKSNRETRTPFKANEYLSHEYINKYTQSQIDFVCETLNSGLLERLDMDLRSMAAIGIAPQDASCEDRNGTV